MPGADGPPVSNPLPGPGAAPGRGAGTQALGLAVCVWPCRGKDPVSAGAGALRDGSGTCLRGRAVAARTGTLVTFRARGLGSRAAACAVFEGKGCVGRAYF